MKTSLRPGMVVLSLAILLFLAVSSANGDGSLAWRTERPEEQPTLIYGEVQILMSQSQMYYCAVNWPHLPGPVKCDAGGYCGIQHQAEKDKPRNVRFSVWDTVWKTLPARLVCKDQNTLAGHASTSEGSAESSKLFYNWQDGENFRFVLARGVDTSGKNILTSFYFFDRSNRKWIAEATIASPVPNNLTEAVAGAKGGFFGSLAAFQENFSSHKHTDMRPRIGLYRLWTGTEPKDLAFVRKATIRGPWGVVNGSFCLAGGDSAEVDRFLAKEPGITVDVPIHWEQGLAWTNTKVKDQPLPPETVKKLDALLAGSPVAAEVRKEYPARNKAKNTNDIVRESKFAIGIVEIGKPTYLGRDYTFKVVPKELEGATYLLRDVENHCIENWLRPGYVTVSRPCSVYVAVLWKVNDTVPVCEEQFAKMTAAGWEILAQPFETTITRTSQGNAYWKLLRRRIEAGAVNLDNTADIDFAHMIFMFTGGKGEK